MKKLKLEKHEFEIVRQVFADRLLSLEETIKKQCNKLDEYERAIRNYTTYDIFCKLLEVK